MYQGYINTDEDPNQMDEDSLPYAKLKFMEQVNSKCLENIEAMW
jgi:hypothetical protein